MVLEYCQAGSVYTLLEQPVNNFGFQEKEFLVFLFDISESRYLLCLNIEQCNSNNSVISVTFRNFPKKSPRGPDCEQ